LYYTRKVKIVNKEQWEKFLAKPGTGSIDAMMVMVEEINMMRKALAGVREFYSYYKRDPEYFKLEAIASRMDEAAANALGEE
jgi:hypothetical protein